MIIFKCKGCGKEAAKIYFDPPVPILMWWTGRKWMRVVAEERYERTLMYIVGHVRRTLKKCPWCDRPLEWSRPEIDVRCV